MALERFFPDVLDDEKGGRTLIGAGGGIVCAFETDSLNMTPTLWVRIQAKHAELGRMLTDEELDAVVRAEAGHDRNA